MSSILDKVKAVLQGKGVTGDASPNQMGMWEENKHPRAANGQFGSGSGSGAGKATSKPGRQAPAVKPKPQPGKAHEAYNQTGNRTADYYLNLHQGDRKAAAQAYMKNVKSGVFGDPNTPSMKQMNTKVLQSILGKERPEDVIAEHEKQGKKQDMPNVFKKGEKVTDEYGKPQTVSYADESNVQTREGGSYHPTKLFRPEKNVKQESKKYMTPAEQSESRQYWEDLRGMRPDDVALLHKDIMPESKRVSKAAMVHDLWFANYGHLPYRPVGYMRND
jgi:hypothetical protein